jgi:UDP-N-acetylglucosamine 1-carboxyvinyltransferase
MDKIVIEGGRPLRGEVRMSGAKNAALPVLAAALLTKGWNSFRSVPRVKDVETIKNLLKKLGVRIEEGEALRVNASELVSREAPYELVKTMRASVLAMGPLLARCGRARVSLPGGCAIGERPINLHLKGFTEMGARVDLDHGYVEVRADRLRGAQIHLDIPTVTGTINIMMAATLARGRTVINNAAREPEVEELAKVLKKMGARISGGGTNKITVDGVDELRATEHRIIPDRIEAGTYAVAAAITGGEATITNCEPAHLEAVTSKLEEAGVSISPLDNGLRVRGSAEWKGMNVVTAAYPGFPTDMQAQIMAFLCLAKGSSLISETVFENRFMHVSELRRMGASIRTEGSSALVEGVSQLSGAQVMATDLRASACLILAGLAAQGVTTVSRVYHLDRGYENIEEKLCGLGAEVRRER